MKENDFEQRQADHVNHNEVSLLISQLSEEREKLRQREQDLLEQAEELASQKEELTAAIEEIMSKNMSLENTLSQLRERSFELDQILYRTSHDLRSPLSSIKGIISLLKLEPQSEIIRNYGKHIEDKAIQMDELLRSLASLSKSILEEPHFETVDLNKIIWNVIGEYRNLPSWKQVEVQVALGEHKICTDPELITIIFQSLISNAYIFRDASKNGQLIIRSREENGNWIIDVMDDGEGIAVSVQPQIFDMFYRGSERSIGNGLGLYIGKKAADRLKGTIDFHADPGMSRFTVELPVVANL